MTPYNPVEFQERLFVKSDIIQIVRRNTAFLKTEIYSLDREFSRILPAVEPFFRTRRRDNAVIYKACRGIVIKA